MNIYYFLVPTTVIIIIIFLYALYKKNENNIIVEEDIIEDDIIINDDEEEKEDIKEDKKIINESYNYLINELSKKNKKELIQKQKELINNINDIIEQSNIDNQEYDILKKNNDFDINQMLIDYQIKHQDNLDKMNHFYKSTSNILEQHDVSDLFKTTYINKYVKLLNQMNQYPQIYDIVEKEYNHAINIYNKIVSNENKIINLIERHEHTRINNNNQKIKQYNNSVDKLKKFMKTQENDDL